MIIRRVDIGIQNFRELAWAASLQWKKSQMHHPHKDYDIRCQVPGAQVPRCQSHQPAIDYLHLSLVNNMGMLLIEDWVSLINDINWAKICTINWLIISWQMTQSLNTASSSMTSMHSKKQVPVCSPSILIPSCKPLMGLVNATVHTHWVEKRQNYYTSRTSHIMRWAKERCTHCLSTMQTCMPQVCMQLSHAGPMPQWQYVHQDCQVTSSKPRDQCRYVMAPSMRDTFTAVTTVRLFLDTNQTCYLSSWQLWMSPPSVCSQHQNSCIHWSLCHYPGHCNPYLHHMWEHGA